MWLIVIATSFYQRVEMLVIKAFDEMVDDILKTKDFTETFGTYPNVRFKEYSLRIVGNSQNYHINHLIKRFLFVHQWLLIAL